MANRIIIAKLASETDSSDTDSSETDSSETDSSETDSSETDSEVDVEVAARLRVAIARLSRQLRQQAGTSLSPTLQSVLASIALHGPLSLGDLAAREQVAPPTITKLLGKLDEQGLIERRRDADDRRVILVSLTDAGRLRFDESRTRRTAWLVRRLTELNLANRAQLLDVVGLLEAIVEPETTGPRAPMHEQDLPR